MFQVLCNLTAHTDVTAILKNWKSISILIFHAYILTSSQLYHAFYGKDVTLARGRSQSEERGDRR